MEPVLDLMVNHEDPTRHAWEDPVRRAAAVGLAILQKNCPIGHFNCKMGWCPIGQDMGLRWMPGMFWSYPSRCWSADFGARWVGCHVIFGHMNVELQPMNTL